MAATVDLPTQFFFVYALSTRSFLIFLGSKCGAARMICRVTHVPLLFAFARALPRQLPDLGVGELEKP